MSENTDLKLDELSKLEQNWDSYNAYPIKPLAIKLTRLIINALEQAGIPEPYIFPSPDGSVSLAWGKGDFFENFTLGISDQGVSSIYIADNEGFYAESQITNPTRSSI